jgi:hypothetical protein
MPGHSQMLGLTLSGGVLLAVSFVPALAAPSGAALTDAKAQAAQSAAVKVNGYLRPARRPVVGHVRPRYQARRIHAATYYGQPRAYYRSAYRHAAPPAYYASPAYGFAPRAYGYARPAYYAPPAYGYARPAYYAAPAYAYAPPAYAYAPPAYAYAPPAYAAPPAVQVYIVTAPPYPTASYRPPSYYETPAPAYYGYYAGAGYYDGGYDDGYAYAAGW